MIIQDRINPKGFTDLKDTKVGEGDLKYYSLDLGEPFRVIGTSYVPNKHKFECYCARKDRYCSY